MKKLIAAGIAALVFLGLLTACRELDDIPLAIWAGTEWENQNHPDYTITLGNDSLTYRNNNNQRKTLGGLRLGSRSDPEAETAVQNLGDAFRIADWVYKDNRLLFFIFNPVNEESKARQKIRLWDQNLIDDMPITPYKDFDKDFLIVLQ
jgi:hypothetical protein